MSDPTPTAGPTPTAPQPEPPAQPPQPAPPAGWFADPWGPEGSLRWWSGREWTGHTSTPERLDAVARAARPPHKWIGRFGGWWIAGGCVAVWVYLLIWSLVLTPLSSAPTPREYAVVEPFLLLTGAWCAAAALLYTMAYRVDPARDGFSVARLVGGGLLAGFLAALAAGPINSLIDGLGGGTAGHPSTPTLAVVGFVEEGAKLAATMVLARGITRKTARTGLFLGGAVGFGFACIENIGYLETAWSTGLVHDQAFLSLLGTSIARQVMGPLLHPVMTALISAAVFAGARGGRFRFTWLGLGAYLAVAVVHSLFDLGTGTADRVGADPEAAGGIALLTIVLVLGATATGWTMVARRLKRAHLAAIAAEPVESMEAAGAGEPAEPSPQPKE